MERGQRRARARDRVPADRAGARRRSATATSSTSSAGEHLTLAINDQYAPGGRRSSARRRSTATRRTSPTSPTRASTTPTSASSPTTPTGSRASRPRDATGQGTVDARSHGFGAGDPPASATQLGAGTLAGGNLGTLAFTRQYKTWGPAPPIAPRPTASTSRRRTSRAVTINPKRAGVGCNVDLRVTSDGPLTVKPHRLQADGPGALTAHTPRSPPPSRSSLLLLVPPRWRRRSRPTTRPTRRSAGSSPTRSPAASARPVAVLAERAGQRARDAVHPVPGVHRRAEVHEHEAALAALHGGLAARRQARRRLRQRHRRPTTFPGNNLGKLEFTPEAGVPVSAGLPTTDARAASTPT